MPTHVFETIAPHTADEAARRCPMVVDHVSATTEASGPGCAGLRSWLLSPVVFLPSLCATRYHVRSPQLTLLGSTVLELDRRLECWRILGRADNELRIALDVPVPDRLPGLVGRGPPVLGLRAWRPGKLNGEASSGRSRPSASMARASFGDEPLSSGAPAPRAPHYVPCVRACALGEEPGAADPRSEAHLET